MIAKQNSIRFFLICVSRVFQNEFICRYACLHLDLLFLTHTQYPLSSLLYTYVLLRSEKLKRALKCTNCKKNLCKFWVMKITPSCKKKSRKKTFREHIKTISKTASSILGPSFVSTFAIYTGWDECTTFSLTFFHWFCLISLKLWGRRVVCM